MQFQELVTLTNRAIEELQTSDRDLFTLNASEWTIAHRLAVYLERQIPGWNVDCEYNRQGGRRDLKKRASGKVVRPDITLHHRSRLDRASNLLIVEVKKKETDSDLGKACEYTNLPSGTRGFQYQFGLALSFEPDLRLHWFTNGAELFEPLPA